MTRPTDLRTAIAAGQTIFREGESGTCAYLVEAGLVEIITHRESLPISLARRGPGEIFGEMALVDQRPRSASAVALEATTLLTITRQQLLHRLEDSDPVLKMLLHVILTRFRETLDRLRSEEIYSPRETQEAPESIARQRDVIERIRLDQSIERAISQGQFELHYQPLIDLSTHRVAAFEALMRWNHPEDGLVSPLRFLPEAESCGLMPEIGRWVVNEVCRRLPSFLAIDPNVSISFNLSASDLCEPSFLPHLVTTLDATGVDPTRLIVEITESTLMKDPEVASSALNECRRLGLGLAIDDFGTGYSSLSYLQRFPIQKLKIDRSFVERITEDPQSLSIIRTICGLADSLGLTLVAEGVETPDQEALLIAFGCHYGQGYLYSPPRPLDGALELL